MRSLAYAGPDDWQDVTWEWLNPATEEYQPLTVTFEVYLNTAVGDQLRVTDVRDVEDNLINLPPADLSALEAWLRTIYEPTQDL